MAIFTNVYGDGHTPDYEGCVLDWYEHNGYDDSDWYAICWNEEKQTIDQGSVQHHPLRLQCPR